MLKRSLILDRNKTRIVQNWVSFYKWHNKDIKQSINKTLEHYSEMTGIELDITVEEVRIMLKEYVAKCIKDINYLARELNKDRRDYYSPSYKNLKEYFKGNELPFNDVKEYQMFLKNYVITEF